MLVAAEMTQYGVIFSFQNQYDILNRKPTSNIQYIRDVNLGQFEYLS